MKKALLTILQYLIFLGLGIWIVYYMLHTLSAEKTAELVADIKSIDTWYLVPIFFAGFFSHFFRALRWRYLLETVGTRPSVTNTTFAVLIGYIINLVLPRAGEVAKCTVLAKYEKTPAHKMIGTIVAERAFDFVCLIFFSVFAFLVQFRLISDYVAGVMHLLRERIREHQMVLFVALGAVALLIALGARLYRKHRETKVGRFVKEMSHGVMSIIHMRKRWKFMIYTLLIWLMYLSQVYFGMLSLPSLRHLTPLAGLVVLCYGSVGMIITPGGIGMYTLMVAEILEDVYAVPEVPAKAFGGIAWGVQTGIIILLGTISLVAMQVYNRRRSAALQASPQDAGATIN